MLTDDKIIGVIKEYEREFAILKKDSDAFRKKLSQKILNTIDKEKECVLEFFLREIEYNKNQLCMTALSIIVEMRAVELCPRIVDIYNKVSKYKDDEWKKVVVVYVLMQLRYQPPKELYRNYVWECIKNNKNSFYLLVQYCNVDPVESLPLLSNEIVEKILSKKILSRPPEIIGNSLQGIGLLVADLIGHFKNNSNDYLPQLLQHVYDKKPKAAIYLKDTIISYLSSGFAQYSYSKSWLDSEIKKINNFVL